MIPLCGGLPPGHGLEPSRLLFPPRALVTSLHPKAQSPLLLLKLKVTPSHGRLSTQLLQGLPYHLQAFSPMSGAPLPVLAQSWGGGGGPQASRSPATKYHMLVTGHAFNPCSGVPMAPHHTVKNPVDWANCLAAVQGQAGSHRIWADRRKFAELLGCLI